MSASTLEFDVTDVTGQRTHRVNGLPPETTVDEVVQRLLAPMQQPRSDPEGRALAYALRNEREGRYLGGNERIGDTIQPRDTVRILPTVEAGRG